MDTCCGPRVKASRTDPRNVGHLTTPSVHTLLSDCLHTLLHLLTTCTCSRNVVAFVSHPAGSHCDSHPGHCHNAASWAVAFPHYI